MARVLLSPHRVRLGCLRPPRVGGVGEALVLHDRPSLHGGFSGFGGQRLIDEGGPGPSTPPLRLVGLPSLPVAPPRFSLPIAPARPHPPPPRRRGRRGAVDATPPPPP